MKKFNIDWGLVGMIAMGVILWISLLSFFYSITKTEEAGQSFVGKDVVFQGDTLMVIDYSFMKTSYTLSNGLVIDEELLQSLETIK